MEKTYKEFSAIKVPYFLDNPDWTDTSWGNDVTATSTRKNTEPYELKVWVHPAKKSDRESPEYPRYWVIVYDDKGNEIDSRDANTDKQCIFAIEYFMETVRMLQKNAKADHA